MTTWFAQKGSCNIDSVSGGTTSDVWNDVAGGGGNWMDTSVLTAGGATVLVANGQTAIAINIDINLGTGTITNAATGGTAGGQFTTTTASEDRSITANVVGQDSGTATANGCLDATLHATNGLLTITGNITGGGVSAAHGLYTRTVNGLLTVTGNVTGGSAANAQGIFSTTTLIATVTGTITGGSNATAYGLSHTSAGALTLSVGAVTAATARGIQENASGSTVITVTGAVTAGTSTTQPAISTAGIVIMGSGSSIVSNSTSWMFPIWGRIKWETTDTGMTITLYDAAAGSHVLEVPDYPAVGTVALGTAFDYTTKTGTRVDADPGDVREGEEYGNPASPATGTFAVPAEEDVEDGVFYGADGTEFEGSYVGGGGGEHSHVFVG